MALVLIAHEGMSDAAAQAVQGVARREGVQQVHVMAISFARPAQQDPAPPRPRSTRQQPHEPAEDRHLTSETPEHTYGWPIHLLFQRPCCRDTPIPLPLPHHVRPTIGSNTPARVNRVHSVPPSAWNPPGTKD